MPLREQGNRDEYPTWIGLIFVFNLIVGTGALTLPAVFAKTGWALGFVIIVILAFISYITVTFVIETMACANAVIHFRRLHLLKNNRRINDSDREQIEQLSNDRNSDNDLSDNTIEHTPLFSQNSHYYLLDNKIELGEMADLFFNNIGRILFYLCIAIYLYGDLSIYSAAVAKSMRDVICSKIDINTTTIMNITNNDNIPCWNDGEHTLTRLDCYRLSLVTFIMILGPFVFFNVTKTKYLQMLTIFLRWLAFTVMIVIAVYRLFKNGNTGKPSTADLTGVPALFGACIYSFMCHHSLPSLISPIKNKKSIKSLISYDYLLICCFYLLLAITGAFAFSNLYDLYTLNFIPSSSDELSMYWKILEYFLALFPVFTLSASFPIIAITLRNNLQTLFLDTTRLNSYNFLLRKLIFPLLALLPPIIITFFTDSVTSLVLFTGSYAGTGIQYLIPIFLVYSARRTCTNLLGYGIVNDYQSPFKNNLWLLFVLLWSITCVIFVTVNFFVK